MSELLQELMAAEKSVTGLLWKYSCHEPWFVELLHYMEDKVQARRIRKAHPSHLRRREQFVEHQEGVEKVRRRNEEIAASDLGTKDMVQAGLEYHKVLHQQRDSMHGRSEPCPGVLCRRRLFKSARNVVETSP